MTGLMGDPSPLRWILAASCGLGRMTGQSPDPGDCRGMIGVRGRIVRRGQGRCDVRCAVGQGDNAPVITVSEITSATRSVGALAAFSFSQKWLCQQRPAGRPL